MSEPTKLFRAEYGPLVPMRECPMGIFEVGDGQLYFNGPDDLTPVTGESIKIYSHTLVRPIRLVEVVEGESK